MSGARKTKPKPHANKFGPHPDDAKHVRKAFAEDARHPERRKPVTPEELRRWAETGEWPASSD
jgi:hypothetical protein